MTLSRNWIAVSSFAITALVVGGMASAGCSVTSGTVTDSEGGVTTPEPDGGDQDTSVAVVDGSTNACPGNTGQTADLVSATCQSALNTECCTELTACFTMAGVASTMDCNVYSACIADCKKPATDGAAPTPAEENDCDTNICDLNASPAIQTAYTNLIACATSGAQSSAACQ
jgi:hypothetical protein